MAHILVICTANICRSPVGEAILRDRLAKQGLESWAVSSAGTWALAKRGAAKVSIQLMDEQGLDLKAHRARMVKRSYLEEADLVLCMEAGQAEALRAEFPAFASKIHLLSEMVGMSYNVKDPYGQPVELYREMVSELTGLIESGLKRIVELATQNAGGEDR
jgi:protein-tyrosine-phosphatase